MDMLSREITDIEIYASLPPGATFPYFSDKAFTCTLASEVKKVQNRNIDHISNK